ncbi:MAG TPA: antibiotic biosynthesis monooxygenase family protein [Gaiellaceae bacterium]|nr:antibiotic biosynthesis monooxygenase family protein [Gaiellaceae bacterium]
MGDVWTHGTWTVRPGREDDFVRAWRELARRATSELDFAGRPTLLRDRETPNVFVSFGPWPSIEDVNRFRSSTVFRESVAAMEDLLESFEPRTLDEMGVDG